MTETQPRAPTPDEADRPAQRTDVFVSYSRADREIVVGLVAGLDARGLRAWVDLEDIPPSAEWMAEIRAAIEAADGYLVVVSPALASSEVCAEELELAREAGKRIVPVMVRTTDPGSVPGTLAALNWIDATGVELDGALDRAVEALRTDLEHVRAHTKLGVRAAEWERKDDTKALLLRGGEIAEAEAVVASGLEPRATPVQARFVQTSRSAATKRQRGTISAVAAALVVSLALSAFALVQRGEAIEQRDRAEHEANVSRSRELALASVGQLASDPETSLLLALEAARVERTPQAQAALDQALTESRIRSAHPGHDGAVLDVEVSADGAWWVTGSQDGTIRVWDATTGQESRVIEGNSGPIVDVQISSDGKWILSLGEESAVVLWGVDDGRQVASWEGRSAGLSPTGELVVVVAGDGSVASYSIPSGSRVALGRCSEPDFIETIGGAGSSIYATGVRFDARGDRVLTAAGPSACVWDPRTGRASASVTEEGGIFALAISPDGSLAATSHSGGLGEVWRTDGGRTLFQLEGKGSVPVLAAFSPDGASLLTADDAAITQLWNTDTGRLSASIDSRTSDAEFSADGSMVVTGSGDGIARVVSVPDGDEIAFLPGQGAVGAVAFTPDEASVLRADEDGTLRTFSVRSGGFLSLGDPAGISDMTWFGGNLLTLSPDGTAAVTAEIDGSARVWDVTTGDPIDRLAIGTEPVILVAFDPSGSTLLTASSDGRVILWDWPSLEARARFTTDQPVAFAGFSDSGPFFLVTQTQPAQNISDVPLPAITVHDLVTGTPIAAPVEWDQQTTYGAVITPSGDEVIFSKWKAVVVDDVATGETRILGEHARPVASVAVSPDGKHVLSSSWNGTAALWDLETGERVRTYGEQGGASMISALFSPDGSQIVAATRDDTATVWGVETGEPVLELRGHTGDVAWASFSPDASMIETEADAVRLFDSRTGELLATVNVPGEVADVEFLPDEPAVVITDVDGRTSVFRCEVCTSYAGLIALAESRVTRDLTAEERERFGVQ